MITILWIAVLFSVSLAVGTLLLLTVLAGRVRDVQEKLRRLGAPFDVDLPEPGSAVPRFSVTTTDGEALSESSLAGPDTLVLFYSASCDSCLQSIPALKRLLSGSTSYAAPPIAVVLGRQEERAGLVAELQPLVRLVVSDGISDVAARLPRLFGVNGYPAVLLVGAGIVRQAGHDLSDLDLELRSNV